MRILRYIHYKRIGLKNAWQLAGMDHVLDQAKAMLGILLFIVCTAFLLSEKANALNDAADNRAASKITKQAEYIAGLEKIVASCLSDAHLGKPIKIGDEWFLCSIQPLGRFN